MKQRVDEIDFTKCVMILLMIAFHLVYIGDTYADAKALVYTFHMPAFLIISGYLLNMEKSIQATTKSMLWIALPYAIMETGYIAGAAVLPIREHIDNLTILGYLDRLILNPIGPYWYLHTLIICTLLCRLIYDSENKICKYSKSTTYILIALFMWCLSHHGIIAFSSGVYFLIGVILRNSGAVFTKVFQGTWLAVLAFIALAAMTDNPDRFTLAGVAITYLAMNISVKTNELTEHYLPKLHGLCLFIGRNTLLLLLFSPIFTILAKGYQPFMLNIEPTGMLFMCVSVVFAVVGSIAIGWVMDMLKLSPWIFGRKAISK